MKVLERIRENLLFHGTAETIKGNLRGGDYDKILWTAEVSTIAQNYIPAGGIITSFRSPMHYEYNEKVTPSSEWYKMAVQMGYEAEVKYDTYNRIQSWRWKTEKVPTVKDVIDYIEKELGYQKDCRNLYLIKTKIENKKEIYLPKNYKLQGTLYILEGKKSLNIFDYTEGREADINEPDYHKLNLFRKIEQQGYDAIKIFDFAQSKNCGNIGHTSIGLFPAGIAKLKIHSIPATNWDWNEDCSNLDEKDTPEFLQWYEQHKEMFL